MQSDRWPWAQALLTVSLTGTSQAETAGVDRGGERRAGLLEGGAEDVSEGQQVR